MVRRIEINSAPTGWEIVTGALGDWLGGDIEIDLRPGGKIDFRHAAARGCRRGVRPGARLTWRWWEEGDEDGATDTVVELAIAKPTKAASSPSPRQGRQAWTWELIEPTWIDPPSTGGILALAGR